MIKRRRYALSSNLRSGYFLSKATLAGFQPSLLQGESKAMSDMPGTDLANAPPDLLSEVDKREPDSKLIRFRWLCALVVVGWAAGCLFLLLVVQLRGNQFTRAVLLSAIVVVLGAAPFITFLTKQWYVRRNEFRNRLSDGALLCYLDRYWLRRATVEQIDFSELTDQNTGRVSRDIRTTRPTRDKSGELFLKIYDEQYGIKAFMTPFILLLVISFANAALVSWLWGCARQFGATSNQCLVFGANPNLATAAMAGAYMFAVGDGVNSVRQNTLNIADVYWYALRLLIAIPLGVAVGNFSGATTDSHTLVAFGLGAFPIEEIQKLLRRITMGQIQTGDTRQVPDQLLSLEGVTVRTSSLLAAEGISSIGQLESKDPVLLAVRTGLEFDFILYLASQAVVRRQLGPSAGALVPLGLVEAQAIRQLVDTLNGEDDAQKARTDRAEGQQAASDGKADAQTTYKTQDDERITRASKTLEDAAILIRAAANTDRTITAPSTESVRTSFEQIAEAPYTSFLSAVAPRGYRIRDNRMLSSTN